MSNPAFVIAGLQAVGTIAKGNAAAKQANLQAELRRRKAERTTQEAAARAAQLQQQRSREDARLRARMLASGIDAGSGSALLALEDRAGNAELDALTELNTGQSKAGLLDSSAQLASLRGKTARNNAYWKAGISLL